MMMSMKTILMKILPCCLTLVNQGNLLAQTPGGVVLGKSLLAPIVMDRTALLAHFNQKVGKDTEKDTEKDPETFRNQLKEMNMGELGNQMMPKGTKHEHLNVRQTVKEHPECLIHILQHHHKSTKFFP